MVPILDRRRLESLIESQGLTQSELVRMSGVSRAQLSRLLARDESRVRQRTLERLAQALKVAPAKLSVGGVLNQYRQSVAHEHKEIDFRGLGMPDVQRQPIQDVFVDVKVVPDDDCESIRGCDPLEGRRRARRPRGQPITATECVSTCDRVIILGNPGCGKTTLLKFLAHQRASRDDGDGKVPIYTRLPELCRAKELDERVDPVKFAADRAAEAVSARGDRLRHRGRRASLQSAAVRQ